MHREITLDSANDRLVFLMSAPDQDYRKDVWRPILTPFSHHTCYFLFRKQG